MREEQVRAGGAPAQLDLTLAKDQAAAIGGERDGGAPPISREVDSTHSKRSARRPARHVVQKMKEEGIGLRVDRFAPRVDLDLARVALESLARGEVEMHGALEVGMKDGDQAELRPQRILAIAQEARARSTESGRSLEGERAQIDASISHLQRVDVALKAPPVEARRQRAAISRGPEGRCVETRDGAPAPPGVGRVGDRLPVGAGIRASIERASGDKEGVRVHDVDRLDFRFRRIVKRPSCAAIARVKELARVRDREDGVARRHPLDRCEGCCFESTEALAVVRASVKAIGGSCPRNAIRGMDDVANAARRLVRDVPGAPAIVRVIERGSRIAFSREESGETEEAQ